MSRPFLFSYGNDSRGLPRGPDALSFSLPPNLLSSPLFPFEKFGGGSISRWIFYSHSSDSNESTNLPSPLSQFFPWRNPVFLEFCSVNFETEQKNEERKKGVRREGIWARLRSLNFAKRHFAVRLLPFLRAPIEDKAAVASPLGGGGGGGEKESVESNERRGVEIERVPTRSRSTIVKPRPLYIILPSTRPLRSLFQSRSKLPTGSRLINQ